MRNAKLQKYHVPVINQPFSDSNSMFFSSQLFLTNSGHIKLVFPKLHSLLEKNRWVTISRGTLIEDTLLKIDKSPTPGGIGTHDL